METVQGVLAREHVVILRVLDQLELALGARDWKALGRAMTFLSTQVPIHRNKEEEILFPELRKACAANCSPVSTFLEEHSDETFHMEVLRRAVEDRSVETVDQYGPKFLSHLRHHIWSEEHALFPMVEALLSEEQKKDVLASFAFLGEMPAVPPILEG